MPKRVTIEALADWLRTKDDVVLLGHLYPDGDAAGTNLALWHALRAMGKRAVVCLPGGMPGLYAYLPGASSIVDPGEPLPFAPKTALAADVAEHERLGEAGMTLFDACPDRAALDHHATNPGFGQVYALDGSAAAAGEMAVDLIAALGVALTPEMAECLLVAISTDCGHFSFSNTRPQTMLAAARCIEAGADIARISEELYRTRTVARTKLLGVVLAGLELSDDGTVAWAKLTDAMLHQTGANKEDSEGIVNYLIEMIGVRVAVLASERGTSTKLSLRSKTSFNVARDLAVPLGGGGHDCAAGATLELPIDAALQKAVAMALDAMARQKTETDAK